MILDLCWQMIKNFLPEYNTPFWTTLKCVEGKCRSRLWRVMQLWLSLLNTNWFLFSATNTRTEYMYCEGNVSIFNCLKRGLHETSLSYKSSVRLNVLTTSLPKIQHNIVLLSPSASSKWAFTKTFYNQKSVSIYCYPKLVHIILKYISSHNYNK